MRSIVIRSILWKKIFVIFLLKSLSNILNFILIRFEIIIIIDFVSISCVILRMHLLK